MFVHRKIRNDPVNGEWAKIRKTISREVRYSAVEKIGEQSAIDMLDFSNLTKSDFNDLLSLVPKEEKGKRRHGGRYGSESA